MDDLPLPPIATSDRNSYTRSPIRFGKKRLRLDSPITTSSDPAVFSGDGLVSPSIEDYPAKRRKSTWIGTWWGEPLHGVKPTPSRKLKRNYDSGFWMASEETDCSLEDEFLQDQLIDDETPTMNHSPSRDANFFRGSRYGLHLDMDKALHSPDATSRTDAPASMGTEAREVIMSCLELGNEDVDLSSFCLQHLSPDLLKPLKFLTKQSAVQESGANKDTYSAFEAELRLYLANNGLQRLPGIIFNFHSLQVLSLRHNNLDELPSAIGKLKNLQTLNVSYNRLQQLPVEILELYRLGNLRYLQAGPNPWLKRVQSENARSFSPSLGFRPSHPMTPGHRIFKVAQTAHVHLNQDGTKILSHSCPNQSVRLLNQCMSQVSSLVELSLRQCRKLPYFAALPELLIRHGDVSVNVRRLLRLARNVQEAGGQSCNTCGREMIIARTERIEWWCLEGNDSATPLNMNSTLAVPFRRRQCSYRCMQEGTVDAYEPS